MIDTQLRQRLVSLSTPLLADARYRLGLPETHLDGSIRPAVPFTRMAGVAVTVRLETAKDEASADLGAMIRAFEAQTKGSSSIMVIQVPEELHNQGIFGEGSATLGRKHGFVGALIDGAVRDTQELKEIEFPTFSRTIAPGYIVGKATAVEAGEPLEIGGRTIHEGDAIMGDNDGLILIRPDELAEVVARAEAIKDWEARVHGAVAQGSSHEEIMKVAGEMP
jgi:4-hydroxy-4-methyl-2-oxoglutarate aldolase